MSTSYSQMTDAQLKHIAKDADEARECARDLGNKEAGRKYGQQAFDATYELELRNITGQHK